MHPDPDRSDDPSKGLPTLRDHIAIRMMAALVASDTGAMALPDEEEAELFAKAAYTLADALIVESEKPQEKSPESS